MTLTREGNSQVFLMNADGSNVRRLTQSSGIDTEPVYSPDGQSIYFTSDRGGGPQVYRMAAGGGAAQRVTFNGDYNISPRLSPDGRLLSYVGRRSGRFQVMVLDIASGTEIPQSRTPCVTNRPALPRTVGCCCMPPKSMGAAFSPRRPSMVVCGPALPVPAGDIREPTWGPFIK